MTIERVLINKSICVLGLGFYAYVLLFIKFIFIDMNLLLLYTYKLSAYIQFI